MRHWEFYTYILTNWDKTVLYTGMTKDLPTRLIEHWIGKEGSFTTRYKVYYLVWFEYTRYVLNAIDREKEIKTWIRTKKDALIMEQNPPWAFRNVEVLGNWPPTDEQMAEVKLRWRERADDAGRAVGDFE